jgi:CDP-4-dehydro-6-deoxyglucose reductase, E1
VERQEIVEKAREYGKRFSAPLPPNRAPVSGKVFDGDEIANAVDALLEGWWTDGKYCASFERALAEFAGTKFASAVNSGSSANHVAFYALTSPRLGKKRIEKGDEVIGAAAGFPTTVNPILTYGAVPVFLDVEIGKYNVTFKDVESAITDKTKAIFLAHTLGNPFEADRMRKLADERGIWLIEDGCDALGSTLGGKMVGSFGHFASFSFYPAHQITCAEGGAVMTSDPLLNKIARSVRDWGRDCWCPTGRDNTCGKRFSQQFGSLPFGYDHKYVYSEIGFNMKLTDIQAAIGLAQMKKLPEFVRLRRANFAYLKRRFIEEGLDSHFILPQATEGSDPCWFGFPLTIRGKMPLHALMEKLNSEGVATRQLFGGNITRQPYFVGNKIGFVAPNGLANTDTVMEKSFWVGVYPALQSPNLEHIVASMKKCVVA